MNIRSIICSVLLLGSVVCNAQKTNISSLNDVIYLDDVTAKAGEQVTLSVQMKNNTISIRGYQFDMYLPDGVSFVEVDDAYADLSTKRTTAKKMNYFDCAKQADGSLRILCASTKTYTLDGTSGEICTVNIKLDSKITDGQKEILIKNAVATNPEAARFELSDVTCILNVGNTNAIDGVSATEKAYDVYSASGIRQTKAQKGVNILKDVNGNCKKVVK